MDKKEVLEKSRKEYKGRDEAEYAVIAKGANIGIAVAMCLGIVFYILQLALGLGLDLGLYAVIFTVPAVMFLWKAVKLKRKHEIVISVLYTTGVICSIIAHVITLLEQAGIWS